MHGSMGSPTGISRGRDSNSRLGKRSRALEYSGEALCVEMHHNVRSRGYEIYYPGARAIWNVGYQKIYAELVVNPADGVPRRKKENLEKGESDSSDYETISNY